MFLPEPSKSEDQKRKDEANKSGNTPCGTCGGTGTIGIGGRGAMTASSCGTCGGTGQKK